MQFVPMASFAEAPVAGDVAQVDVPLATTPEQSAGVLPLTPTSDGMASLETGELPPPRPSIITGCRPAFMAATRGIVRLRIIAAIVLSDVHPLLMAPL